MKQDFANNMLNKDFKSAAVLIFEATLKVKFPDNVNLNINIERDKNIDDLAEKMKKCYYHIDEAYSAISFEKTLTNIFNSKELLEKQNLQENELLNNKAKTLFDESVNVIKKQQYEQIFDSTVLTLNAALQGIVNATIELK